MVGTLKVKQIGHASRHNVGEFTRHRVFVYTRRAFDDVADKGVACRRWKAVLHGKCFGVLGPHSNVGEVAVLTTKCVSEDDASFRSVQVLPFRPVTRVRKSISRYRDSPQLTRVDLRQRTGGLAPSLPVELITGNQSTDFGVCLAFGVLTGPTFLPKVINRSGPSPFRQWCDAHFGIEDVLPEGLNGICIGHHGPEANHSNGLKRTLVQSFAWFSVVRGQGHGITSIHDAFRHHRNGETGVNVNALPGYTR